MEGTKTKPQAFLGEGRLIDLVGNKLCLSPAESQDKPFIISTWVRSYQVINRKLRTSYQETRLRVEEDVFLKSHPSIAEEQWPFAFVLKDAQDRDASGAVLGYVVGQHGVLHYVYLVPELRRMGLSKVMVQSVCGNMLQFSHVWPYAIPSAWKYNPYLVRGSL